MLSQPAHLPRLPHELAHRSDDGLEVVLLWDPAKGARVIVADTRTRDTFELTLTEGDSALDAFYHPFSYAAPRPAARPVPAEQSWVQLRREGRRSPL